MLRPDIQTSLQNFTKSLHSSIPLRHHWEYVEADVFNREAHVESSKAFQDLRNNVLKTAKGVEKRKCAEAFRIEVEKVIQGHRMKNEDLKNQAHLVLMKLIEDLSSDFKSTMERKLRQNETMDLKSIEELLEAGKELVKNYFELHSNHGNDGSCNQKQLKEGELLVKDFQRIENEILKQHRQNLQSISNQDGRKLFKEEIYSPLRKGVEELCQDFKSSMELKLHSAPNINLNSLKHLLDSGKKLANRYFRYHSKSEKDQEQELLDQELKRIYNVIKEEHRRHLKRISDDKVRKLLEKLEEDVLEMSEKVKADSLQWNVTRRKLRERVQEIHTHLAKHGSEVLSCGRNREMYSELLKLEAEDKMSAEEFLDWITGLSTEVKFDIDCEMETPQMLLAHDAEKDAPTIERSIEPGLSQEIIQEEVVEVEDKSHELESPQEMDIDIKLELDGLVLQKSCLKPGLGVKQSPRLDNRSAGSFKRQKLNETQTAEGFPGTIEEFISSTGNNREGSSLCRSQRLPLTQLCQLYEDAHLCEAIDPENKDILTRFIEANPNVNFGLLKDGLQKIIDDLTKKIEDRNPQTESFFRKQVELACETFKASSKANIEMKSINDLMVMKELLKNQKMLAMKCFEDNYQPGNGRLFDKHKEELKGKLDNIENQLFEHHYKRLKLHFVELFEDWISSFNNT